MARLPDSLDVLRTREFQLLFSGQAVSVLGDRMAIVALAFAVLEIGGSTSDVGLVLAAGAFPLVATVLAGGVVADRASRRAVMVAADLVRVASQGAMAALLIAGWAEVWTLALVAGVTGAATGFFSPASTGLLPEVVLAEHLQRAARERRLDGRDSRPGSGRCPGRNRRSKLGDRDRRRDVRGERRLPGDAAGTDVGRGATELLRRRPASGLGRLSVAQVGVDLRRLLRDRERALGGVGRARADRRRARPRRCGRLGHHSRGAALSGAGIALAISVWESTLQRHIPGESLSRVSSYDWFGSLAFYPLGLAIWGPVAAAIGVSVSLWLAFGLAVVVTVTLISVPDIRHLPAAPDVR